MQVKDGLRIVGTGHYAPAHVVTNDDLSKIVDTNDEWISSRTGIRRRHFAAEGEKNEDMAFAAAKMAIDNAGIDKNDIGVVVVATIRPDHMTPSMACMLQKRLEIPEDSACFDVNAACSGFMYGVQIARGLLMQSNKRYAVVVGSEMLSKILDMTDRGTCILFGDGAGAAVIELSDENRYFCVLGTSGDDDVLECPNHDGERFVNMKGSDVFKFAVSTVPKAIFQLIEQADVNMDDIDMFVCHQANQRIVESVSKKCKQSMEKFYLNMDEYGNTSSASIPIALSEMNQKGLLKPGMKIICVGFGGGLTWGGAYFEL